MTQDDSLKCWQEYLEREIPLSRAMNIQVSALHPSVRLEVPLKPNQNNKKTAFAGSLSSALALAGWIEVQRWIDPQIEIYDVVLFKSEMSFKRPIESDFVVEAQLETNTDREQTLKTLARQGKARVVVTGTIFDQGAGRVNFLGHYVALKKTTASKP